MITVLYTGTEENMKNLCNLCTDMVTKIFNKNAEMDNVGDGKIHLIFVKEDSTSEDERIAFGFECFSVVEKIKESYDICIIDDPGLTDDITGPLKFLCNNKNWCFMKADGFIKNVIDIANLLL